MDAVPQVSWLSTVSNGCYSVPIMKSADLSRDPMNALLGMAGRGSGRLRRGGTRCRRRFEEVLLDRSSASSALLSLIVSILLKKSKFINSRS